MSTGAIIFMAISWTFVLGLLAWSYYRIMTAKDHFDPDGTGPDKPPVPGRLAQKAAKKGGSSRKS